MKYLTLLILLLLLSLSLSSHAEDNIVRKGNTIIFDAELTYDNITKVIMSYDKHPFEKIILTSPGGNFEAGLIFGKFINHHDIYVYVPEYCASACVMPFFMATTKDMNENAILALHNVEVDFGISEKSYITIKDAVDAAKEASTSTGIMMTILSAAGIPPDIMIKVAKSFGDDVIELHREDLVNYNILK